MRSFLLVLSACGAVAQAAECQAAEETTLLQGARMAGAMKVRTQKHVNTKTGSAKDLVKKLKHVAHNIDKMSSDDVTAALQDAEDAINTIPPSIEEEVESLQNSVDHAAAAVEACHVEEGVTQRAGLWEAAETQSAVVASCEAELATLTAEEAEICSDAAIAAAQSECACDEARVRREDKADLCAAHTAAYEFAYCEYKLQCDTYHDCHETEMAVYNQVASDVSDAMVPLVDEYIAAEQSACITAEISKGYLLSPPVIDFDAIAECENQDTSHLVIVYPDMPSAPEDCQESTAGSPVCGVNYLVDGCTTAGTSHETVAVAHNSGTTGSVRCCALDGSSCDSDHVGCQEGKTFPEAQAVCEAAGERLCTQEEIAGGICCGTGCNFDSHQIWVTPIPHRVAVDGCPTAGSSPERSMAADGSGATASIRCCSDDGSSCITQDLAEGCSTGLSFLEGRALCESNGRRLCTESELAGGVCCGSGCNYDSHSVWVEN